AKLPLFAFEGRKGTNDIAIVIGEQEYVIKNAISYGFDFKINEFRVNFDQINVSVSRNSANHTYVKLGAYIDEELIGQLDLMLGTDQIGHSFKI
ncbi:hypothetical protein NQU36_26115, partial [Escherichia coli]|uniref:hypothetical protein n=1 Tax=Escherichia coli TaxID=562 RepID=UPI002117365A